MGRATLWSTWLLPLSFSPEDLGNTHVSARECSSVLLTAYVLDAELSIHFSLPHSPQAHFHLGTHLSFPTPPTAHCLKEADPPSVPGLHLIGPMGLSSPLSGSG